MLSIIIPTLNEEDYLPKLLSSIKRQDFYEYEVIVADAGSKDKTMEIAKEYGCKVVKGGRLPAGRNRGAEAATGDLFLFLDADITLPDHFLKNTTKVFREKTLGVAGFCITPMKAKLIDRLAHHIFNGYSWLVQKIFPHAAMAIMSTRETHNAIGGFDEEITFVEDFSYAKAAAKVAKYGLIQEPVLSSMRRYEKDGRMVYLKYVLAELHIIFIGPIKSDIFKYRFGHYKEKFER